MKHQSTSLRELVQHVSESVSQPRQYNIFIKHLHLFCGASGVFPIRRNYGLGLGFMVKG